jgi:hypothetical protein
MIPSRVETYSGYRADERPLRFLFDDIMLSIKRIADRVRGPEYESFQVIASDGNRYRLVHDLRMGHDSWSAELLARNP